MVKMKSEFKICLIICILILIQFSFFSEAHAYIGPGAGFAILTSFLAVFVSFILALFYLVTLPVRLVIRVIRRGRLFCKHKIKKVIVLGFDGMDPMLLKQYIADKKLPHMSELEKKGTFTELQTTTPAISPVAWSSFSTGTNPGKHNIFDFLSRNRETYLPELSSVHIGKPSKYLKLGRYSIPLKKARLVSFKKSKTFWKILGEHGIFSAILHVPLTFPVEKFFGVQVAGMCVPDLRGTQGSFSFFTTDEKFADVYAGGEVTYVKPENNIIKTHIRGPQNPLKATEETLKIPLMIDISDESNVSVKLNGEKIFLRKGEFSDWIKLEFKAGLGIKVSGICRFFLKSLKPHFELYVTPLNINPEKPALPVSHPFIFSSSLAKQLGNYSTLGISDDTWALNERVLDEDGFLKMAERNHAEKEKIFNKMLTRVKKGLVVTVFDISDTVQHMFFRYIDKEREHENLPEREKYHSSIEKVYVRLDNIVGQVKKQIGDDTVLLIMSDHGFKSFRKGVNLNSWLYKNNYLHLKNGFAESGRYFENVDWSKTRAYALGLGGIYINQRGREAQGTVSSGREKEELKKEIAKKLQLIEDNTSKEKVIRNIYDAESVFNGPYKENSPDLIIGYSEGYRASWDSVIGKVTDKIIEINEKCWSGDHCIDPKVVPGVFLCNKKINNSTASITDIAPTILNLFGVTIRGYMDGKNLMDSW